MRTTFRKCRACGDYHWTDNWPANHVEPFLQRSSLPSPNVIRDGLDDLFHPMNNRRYDSKRQFSRTTSQLGGIEVGNEEQKDTRHVDAITKDEVAEAKAKVDQGYVPHPEFATAAETADAL